MRAGTEREILWYTAITINVTICVVPSSDSEKIVTGILYYQGNIEILNQYQSVAVIGSRKISAQGKRFAYWTGKAVAEAGMNVVNGLAIGCDSEALRGAVENGGRCVVILPCGLDCIVPKCNEKLADLILENGGCLISEYKAGVKPERYRYVERDRLQSGVSQGVLVVEAEENSGTMHTVKYALKQNRRLAYYYYKLLNMSTGNRTMEELGKAQILKEESDLHDFLQEILNTDVYQQMTLQL